MNPFLITSIVFAILFAAGLVGLRVRAALTEHHLTEDSKESVRVGMAFVGSMAALLLALLISSTANAYDAEKGQVTQLAAKIIFLDRVLAGYGPDSAEPRAELRRAAESAVVRMWPTDHGRSAQLDPSLSWSESLPNLIHGLAPHDDRQTAIKSQALALAGELGEMRWLLFEEAETSVSVPLLAVVVVWLTMTFLSIGLFAPANRIVITALLLSALSAAGAVFLILELDMPFDGLLRLSSTPMQKALAHLGQ
ncbi:MAG: DUF4239 domain-containing protein [Phycisphaerales bacterium]|nr:DUF4239 domain-containing protein [Phycisphaerales bacterium]